MKNSKKKKKKFRSLVTKIKEEKIKNLRMMKTRNLMIC